MIRARMDDELLTRAFEGFERAASRLQGRHHELQQQIERLERQLLDAHRRLEAVVDTLDTGVAVLARDGSIVRANRAFHAMRLERSGRLDPDLLPAGGCDSTAAGTTRLRRATERGDRDLALTVVPTGDAEGSRVLSVQDVTEIRREEVEGGRRSRLEALGRLSAEIAHEVRNPLGSIRLFAGMLVEDLEDRKESREMAEQILVASSSLESIVSNLLAFASPSSANRRRLDLCALSRDTCALLAPVCALRGVRLDPPPGEATCEVQGDPEGLRQVLLNLLGNALAATGTTGRIRVTTRRENERAVLVVEDDGKGIAREDLHRVFDPFFTRSEGGTGLGLSIVHGIVERHGGEISLDSQDRRGTRVRVELPAARVGE